jgi:hypothetical protein
MKRLVVALAALALLPSTAHAAAFSAPSLLLDPNFAPDSAGIAQDDFATGFGGTDIPSSVVVANGDVYTVGSTTVNNAGGLAVVARRLDGTLDTGFDGDGKLFIASPAGTDQFLSGSAVALPNGHLRVLAGIDVDPSSSKNVNVEIVGLLPDGSLERDFGVDGTVMFDVGSNDDSPSKMVIDANGRIAVTGSTSPSNVKDTFVSLRNPDGSPAAFGAGGVRVIPAAANGLADQGMDVAFRPGGGLAVLITLDPTSSCANGATDAAVIHGLQGDGSDDPTFGTGGDVPLPVGTPTCASALIEHGGRLWATGKAFTRDNSDAFLVRLDAGGTGLQIRRFQMLGTAGATDVTSAGGDLTVLSGPPETLVVVGSSKPSSAPTGQFAAAAFNDFDGDLAAAQYGEYVSSGTNEAGLLAATPAGPNAVMAAGLKVDLSNNFDTSFATARLLLDSGKSCDAAVDVPSPLELKFVGRKSSSATITVTNKGQKPCPGAVVNLAAPYKLGRVVSVPALGPGEAFTAGNVPVATPTIRRDDDVAKFSVSVPGDGDASNDVRTVRVVFSFCDLALSAVRKPSTVPSEGTRRVEVGLDNKGTTTCRRVRMKVSGGTGGGASKPYSIDRGRSVSDDVNLGVKRGTKVGRKVALRVRATSVDEDVVAANDSIRLTSRVVGVGDTRVAHAGASVIRGTAKRGKAARKKDAKGVRLARVEVAVRRLGKSCRWLSGKRAHFKTRKQGARCTPTGWQAAKGTRSWRLSMRALPAGRYQVFSRAVTKNGFREAHFAASDRNRVAFRVR